MHAVASHGKSVLALALAGALLSPLIAPAATAQAPALVPPQPISQEGKDFPGFGGREGFYITRYTVKADGSVADVEVLGGYTNSFTEQMIPDVVGKWTFEPGTHNGEAVDFLNQRSILRARISLEPGISPEVKEKVDDITELVAEGDYKKALRDIDRLLVREPRSIFDYALLQDLKASMHAALEENFAALAASKMATLSVRGANGEEEYLLTPEVLEPALRRRFIFAVTARQYAEALRAYELLEGRFEIAQDDVIREQAAQVRALVESPDPLISLASLGEEGSWSYVPSRRIFTVSDIDGRLRRIQVRCQRQNLELDYQENVDWTLPESLGACELEFQGGKDTRFTLYEFSE